MSGSEPGRREVAYRLFAAEFDDAEFSYRESDEERAPNYVVTPSGARVNRLFAVGVLTEVDDVNPEMVRGRLVDPTGAFVTYAGQYQPEALAALERADPPGFFALTGKARTYEPEDGDQIYSSVRPESVGEVDGETRDRWVVTAAERTIERVGVMASAIESGLEGDQLRAALTEADVDERLADGVALALDHYGTTPAYLSKLKAVALDAVRVVAGERDEVDRLELAPGEGTGDAEALATIDLSAASTSETAAAIGVSGANEDPTPGVGDADPIADEEPTPQTETEPEPAPEETTPTAGTETTDATGTPEPAADREPSTEAETGEGPTGDAGMPESDPVDDGASDPLSETDTGEEIGAFESEGDPEDFDPGEFELDEEERREVEDEFGTEFSTADEIEPADIDPEGAASEDPVDTEPDPDSAEGTPAPEPDADGTQESDPPEDDGSEDAAPVAPDEDAEGGDPTGSTDDAVDLEDAVMSLMGDLDDGDGVERDVLIEAAADAHGADPGAVDEAIQDALMSGRCYEPADDTLKPI